MSRVFVVGLDGGTWRILKPLMDQGLMPNLSRLVCVGAAGDLASTMPPITPPAWATFQTGVSPGRHGIYDFNRPVPNSYQTEFVSSTHLPMPTIWSLASRADRRVVVLNVPVTYPPYAVNGQMVSGMETPSLGALFTYPPELGGRLRKAVPGYRILTTRAVFNFAGLRVFVDRLRQTEEARVRAMEYLLGRQPWDLAMIHFQSTDILQHALYPHLDPGSAGHDPRVYRRALGVYQTIDEGLGRLLERVSGPDTLIVVMSDHGFRPAERSFYLNEWLRELEYMVLRRGSSGRALLRAVTVRLRAWDRFNVTTLLHRAIKDKVRGRLTTDLLVDWGKTRVYGGGWWAGFVQANLRGREPDGCVDPEAARELMDEIGDRLLGARTPDGQPVVSRIHRREDIFSGPLSCLAPDLLAEPAAGIEINKTLAGETYRRHLIRRDPLGTHDPAGVLVLSGGGTRRDQTALAARMVDVPFTILHYLGLPVPEHFEGRLLREAFDDQWLAAHPVRRSVSSEIGEAHTPPGGISPYSPSEEERITRRLEDLGYL